MNEYPGNDMKLPHNADALLKEYEIKFNYTSGLSPRVLSLMSTHIVFLGALLLAIAEEKVTYLFKLGLVVFNIVFCVLCSFWLIILGKYYNNTCKRINEIANYLKIGGYHQDIKENNISKVPFKFVIAWFVLVSIFMFFYF